jgi:hypothetical protein
MTSSARVGSQIPLTSNRFSFGMENTARPVLRSEQIKISPQDYFNKNKRPRPDPPLLTRISKTRKAKTSTQASSALPRSKKNRRHHLNTTLSIKPLN